MSENKQATLAITKARVQLLLDNPFLGTLALRSKLVQVEDNDPRAPASTDGTHLYYSPKFWLDMDDKQRKGVLAHEIAHNALLHSARLKGREHEKFNRAADYAINDLIVNTFGYSLPKDVLLDKKYYELTAEEIYNRLEADEKSGNTGGGQAPSWGQVLPSDGDTPEQQQANEEAMAGAVRAAANVAKRMGKLPGNLARMLDFLEPKVNWREALRDFLTARFSRDDYRWFPCDQQYLHMDIRVPTLAGESFGPVAICIDTSGSIGEKELSEFLAEVSGILEDCKPEKAYVIYCDAAVNNVDEFTVEDLPIKPVMYGGGGTSFKPPFRWLEERGIEPECLIYLTDMYGDFPLQEPHFPVIWCRTSKENAPFGTHIDLDFD